MQEEISLIHLDLFPTDCAQRDFRDGREIYSPPDIPQLWVHSAVILSRPSQGWPEENAEYAFFHRLRCRVP